MSKDTADISSAPMPEDTPATQTSLDLFNSFLNAPVSKLDADEYMVHDIHGVTESLMGSGNMNFLMLQAGQTNEFITNSNPFDLGNNNEANIGSSNLFSPNADIAGTSAVAPGNETASDRPFERADDFRTFGESSVANNHNTTTGSLSASNLAANTQSVTPFSDTSAFSSSSAVSNSSVQTATNGTDGTSGLPGIPGTSGTSGENGTPGTPGEGGGPTTIINNFIDDTTHLGDTVTNLIDNTVHNTTDLLTEIVNNAGDIVTTTINSAGDVLTTTINNAGDIITTTVNDVTNIVNNIFDGHLPDLGPIGLNLDATLDDLTHLNLDILNGGNILNVINETIDLSPVLDPITGLVGDIVSNVSLDVLLDPFQYDNSPTDTDLHVGTGLDLLGLGLPDLAIDIPLDPIEGLLGDIDLSLDVSQTLTDLLGGIGGGGNADTDLGLGGLNNIIDLSPVTDGLEGILNPVENLIGDVDIFGNIGLGLLGTDADAPGAADTDISIPLDLGLLDNSLLGDALNISLDPLESITGDIDLNLAGAVNLLGDIAAPLIDHEAGGTGMDNPLSMVGDGLADLVGGLLPLGDSGDHDLGLSTGIDALDNNLLDNGLGVVLDPVENLLGDIDLGGNIGLDLLGTNDTSGADTDIVIPIDIAFIDSPLLNDGLNISLDPIESLTGDIDLDLTAAGNLFGDMAPGLIDALNGGTGGDDPLSQIGNTVSDALDHLLPFDSGTGDTDLSLDTHLGLGDTSILDNATDLVLDPVEHLVGDIDIGGDIGLGLLGSSSDDVAGSNDLNIGLDDLGINIGLNLDPLESIVGDIDLGANISTDLTSNLSDPAAIGDILLGGLMDTLTNTVDTAVGLLDNSPVSSGGLDLGALTGGLGDALDIPSWTENVLPDPGNVLGGGIPDPISAIPDIISAAVTDLPVPVLPVVTGALGGILGGGSHHHGGLFG